MPSTLTVEQILRGCGMGRLQAAGQMAVVPILRDGAEDSEFASPENINASTRDYGSVRVRNTADRPTIVPTGSAWVVDQAAQDHAVGSGALLKAGQSRSLNNARCIQESQGGLIRADEYPLTILPVGIRSKALAIRKEQDYSALWPVIAQFQSQYGIRGASNLIRFLQKFEAEMDQFIAQFEIVPNQVGAIIMVAGHVVGVEVAPSVKFWEAIWTPLIRVSYGSLAIKAGLAGLGVPSTRQPLVVSNARSLSDVSSALRETVAKARELTTTTVEAMAAKQLTADVTPDDTLDKSRLLTVASPELAGQIVTTDDTPVYASLCAPGA